MEPIRSTEKQHERQFALSPLQIFLATTRSEKLSETRPRMKENESIPAGVPGVVEEKLDNALMALTGLRGRVART